MWAVKTLWGAWKTWVWINMIMKENWKHKQTNLGPVANLQQTEKSQGERLAKAGAWQGREFTVEQKTPGVWSGFWWTDRESQMEDPRTGKQESSKKWWLCTWWTHSGGLGLGWQHGSMHQKWNLSVSARQRLPMEALSPWRTARWSGLELLHRKSWRSTPEVELL